MLYFLQAIIFWYACYIFTGATCQLHSPRGSTFAWGADLLAVKHAMNELMIIFVMFKGVANGCGSNLLTPQIWMN